MSQAKVDQRKQAKTHRKQTMRREKLERGIAWVVVAVIIAAICIWIGFSVAGKAGSSSSAADSSSVTVNTDAIDDYLDGLGEDAE